MKVLMQNRKDALTHRGGDTVQMLKTQSELVKLGVHVDISVEAEPSLIGYDLVHIFNIQTADYGYQQLMNAKRYGLPVAVSTIFWDTRHISKRTFLGNAFAEINRSLSYKFLENIPGYSRSSVGKRKKRLELAKEMLVLADILLPNSYAESEIVAQLFKLPSVRSKSHVVPNGVEFPVDGQEDRLSESSMHLLEKIPVEFVLQVGRIEEVKGQLKVIKALQGQPEIPLLFIGRGSDTNYGQECRRAGNKRGNTFFVEEVPHQELSFFYKKAKVHTLPSLRESPGLVTLEAALYDTNCVVSFHGPVAEYFGSNVWYCDPDNDASLREAVIGAWKSPINTELKSRILRNFTWHHAGLATLEAYQLIINHKRH